MSIHFRNYIYLTGLVFLVIIFIIFFKEEITTEDIETEAQAVEIAKKSWISIYEKTSNSVYSTAEIKCFEPYKAILKNNKWIVTGTVPNNYTGMILSAEITIDGQVSVFSVGTQ